MTVREKVVEALEACVLKDPDDSRDCRHCPRCNYGAFITNSCINGVMADALALLKAQEPCEDAVSRKDVINVLQSPCDMRYVNGNWHPCIGDYIEAITNLSAVAPKAQEPVKPIMHYVSDGKRSSAAWQCGNCLIDIGYGVNYCYNCGQAVKWE